MSRIGPDAAATGRGTSGRAVGTVARIGLVAALLATLLATIGARPIAAQTDADLPETAALVPEDALLFLSVDLDLAADQWAVADDLLTRAGAPGALQRLRGTILDRTAFGTPTPAGADDPLFGGELGVVLTELPDFFGQAVEAGLAGGSSPVATPDIADLANQQGPAFLLQPGEPDAAWEVVRDQVARAADAAGVEVGETTYRDVAIQTVEAESGPDAAVARLDDTIVAAFKPADLEAIIDTHAGDGPTLRDADAMSEVRAELNPELLVFGFGNNEALVEALGPTFEQSQQQSAELNEVLGVASPVAPLDPRNGNFGLGLWAEEMGLRSDFVAVLEGDEPYPVVIRPGESELDARVPANALVFANAFDLGPTGVLSAGVGLQVALLLNGGLLEGTPVATTQAIADQVTPEYLEEQFSQAAAELGFDLRADLLNQLVGEHAFFVALSPAILTGDLDGFNLLFASGVEDAATVAESAQRIAARLERDVDAADVSIREVEGDTLYVVSDPEGEATPTLEFGVVGGEILIGLGGGIDAYLAGPEPALADDEQYQRVMATFPSEHQGSLYVNLGQIIGLVQLATGDLLPGVEADAPAAGTPSGVTDASPAAMPASLASASAIEAFAVVTTTDGNVQRISSILYVGEG